MKHRNLLSGAPRRSRSPFLRAARRVADARAPHFDAGRSRSQRLWVRVSVRWLAKFVSLSPIGVTRLETRLVIILLLARRGRFMGWYGVRGSPADRYAIRGMQGRSCRR